MRRARGIRLIAAVTAATALTTACGDDDDGSTPDIAEIEVAYSDVVESAGTVLGVSVQGDVLREGSDGEWCVADVAGTERDCWAVDQRIQPGLVAWSPDGSKIAFDGRVERAAAFDSEVRVLDLESGEIVTLADDGSDDPAGPQDLLPAWVDDAEVAFLRDRGGSLQIVFAELDGDVETADVSSLSLREIVSPTAAVIDDEYAITVGHGPTEVVGIDDDGEVRTILELAAPDALVGGTSRDTERAVITSGIDGQEITPAIYVAEDVTTTAPFTSTAATVSPDGRLVAAATSEEPGGPFGVTLWDPSGGEPRWFDPGELLTVDNQLGIVWTDDDLLVIWSPGSWQIVTLTAD